MDEFNKRCAEVLGWKHEGNNCFTLIDEHRHLIRNIYDNGFYTSTDMHFHDSYDWAMLLVKEIVRTIKPKKGYSVMASWYAAVSGDFDWWDLTPHQIAQAALEVLETKNKSENNHKKGESDEK